MSQILIDSGAFLAMLDARDKYHPRAQEFLSNNQDATFLITTAIFAETMTLIKARLGAKPAIMLGERIFISTMFQLASLPENEQQIIWTIFKRYDDKDWSYADCSILAAAQHLQISSVFSFDHHIDQMSELRRVPIF